MNKFLNTMVHTGADVLRIAFKTFMFAVKVAFTVVFICVVAAGIFGIIAINYVKNTVEYDVNEVKADFQMSLSSVIYCIDPETGDERELVTLQSSEFRSWVDYEDMPDYLIYALVAIEDHRFFDHKGVDWYRTAGAMFTMAKDSSTSFGGSTITQQLIKNITGEKDVTVQRKVNEIFLALEYEKLYSKEEIVELYLNLVYFGHGCYGIGAASSYYFGKEVSDLTVYEAASIIGITNNPSLYSPYSNRTKNKERQETILYRMKQLGYIETEEEYVAASDAELVFKRGIDDEAEVVTYTWFEEAVIRDVLRDLQEVKGYTAQWARLRLYAGGLKIIATIDPKMQAIVDSYYTNPELMPTVSGSSQGLQSGIVIIDPYTSEVKAVSGGIGVKEGNMLLSRATMARRPPGSSIKPLASYAPAMDAGILTPDTRFFDSSYIKLSGTSWLPQNSDRKYRGMVTARQAVSSSLNTIASVVLDQLTPDASYTFMCDVLGFKLDAADRDYAPLAIGQLTYGATVLEMAAGFSIFPNGGEYASPRTYSMVYDSTGEVYLDNTREAVQAISDKTAYWMTDMLTTAATSGTGSVANLRTMPTAGKTGTSTDDRDRWFVGFTPYYVAAVWTGFDMPATIKASSNPAAQIWKMIMSDIHTDLERKEFTKPEDVKQTPVRGIASVAYTIQCVDAAGSILHTETSSGAVGYPVTVKAVELGGYTLTSSYDVRITLSSNAESNLVTFVYVSNTPPILESTPEQSPPNHTEDNTESSQTVEEPAEPVSANTEDAQSN